MFFYLKNYSRPGTAKRRIIGGVVRAPSEAIPVATLDGRERWTWLKRSAENHEGLDNTSARRFTSKMDPMPPVAPSPESKLAWFMAGCSKRRLPLDLIEVHSCLKQAKQKAGPASNGLRQKDSNFATFEHFSTELFLFYVLTLLSLGRNVGIDRGEKKYVNVIVSKHERKHRLAAWMMNLMHSIVVRASQLVQRLEEKFD